MIRCLSEHDVAVVDKCGMHSDCNSARVAMMLGEEETNPDDSKRDGTAEQRSVVHWAAEEEVECHVAAVVLIVEEVVVVIEDQRVLEAQVVVEGVAVGLVGTNYALYDMMNKCRVSLYR